MHRRDLLLSIASASAWFALGAKPAGAGMRARRTPARIPLVHITDLYHPPQDPDDHIDLATVAALGEYDVRAVILDATRKFLLPSPEGFDIARQPGIEPVLQLNRILGRSIPVAVGPRDPLKSPVDDVADRPPAEQEGVKLLLDVLDRSDEQVVISLVGSARVLTAAFNRRPEAVRAKIRYVLLNAGSLAGPKREWNVGLDPEAYCGLWDSRLPIRWYPCATEQGAFNPDHERGTYWKTTHARIFSRLAPPLREWFTREFASGDEDPKWEKILAGERNMWSTASLVMGAGRVLAQTHEGWRFVPRDEADIDRIWAWRLDPIQASVTADATMEWRPVREGGNALLFGRERGPEFGEAMSDALSALLGSCGTVEKQAGQSTGK